MDSLLKLLSDGLFNYTVSNVVVGGALIGAITGLIGSYALLRKQSLMGDAMSHAALPGIVLIFILTAGLKTPFILLIGAFASAWLGALLVSLVTSRTRIKQDSGLGLVLAVFFGFGLALLSWVQRNFQAGQGAQAGLDKYLFGKAAAIVTQDLIMMVSVGVLILILSLAFWKEFKLLIFDRDFAFTLGYPVKVLDVALTSLLVLGIVVGLQVVGVVLMAAMIVAPAAAARQWTDRLNVMIVLSSLFGALSGAVGALISALGRGLSTGPVIVLVASAIAVLSLFLAPKRGLVWDWIRRRQNRRHLGTQRLLEVLYESSTNRKSFREPQPFEQIQAALPIHNVRQELDDLAANGLVIQLPGQLWALTEEGVKSAVQQTEQTANEPLNKEAQAL